MFRTFYRGKKSLGEVHQATFDVQLREGEFNTKQVFVVVTNGIDHKTREAVQYWCARGLDVRPWVYRVYRGTTGSMLLEMSRFATKDDPYEDIQEGFHILNTNYRNDPTDHETMIREHVASAFFTPWKEKIQHIAKGDVVFLYQSGVGIVALGLASGQLQKRAYQGDAQHPDDDFSMSLSKFQLVAPPMQATEIKQICGVNYRFMSTLFSIDAEAGRKLEAALRSRSRE
jgi:hypothetical protein